MTAERQRAQLRRRLGAPRPTAPPCARHGPGSAAGAPRLRTCVQTARDQKERYSGAVGLYNSCAIRHDGTAVTYEPHTYVATAIFKAFVAPQVGIMDHHSHASPESRSLETM